MDNLESLLEELERFEKQGGSGTTKVLEEYVQHVAKTGDTLFPWHRIRYFMRYMLATVMSDFYENCGGEDVGECGNVPAFSYVPTRDKILHHFDTFSGVPFTIQRLCEIMIDPTRHYKRTDKFLRGLEKNILVVSYIEPGRQRRSEDLQQTLVNGMQEGSLHTSPISGSSRLSPSHQTKRIASPQPTNSVSNNSSDFYDSELSAGDSHVSGSEANGPNGIPLDERSIEAMAEIVEPLMKKRRIKVSPLEKALGPMAHIAHLQDKDSTYMSISEAESLEAEGSDEESNASSSSSSSAKTDEEPMETGEAEATCHTEADENKILEESLCGHQVGTSEMVPQESENVDDTLTSEMKEEMAVPAEACSSDVAVTHETEKATDDSNSVNLTTESSGSETNQGSPDSVEDNSEQSQPEPLKEEVSRVERAGSSEAAAADLDMVEETSEVSEGAAAQEEPNKDSHEADSTSQAQSSSFCSQPSASGVGSSTLVTSCTSPPTASTSAGSSALSPVESPPSDSGGPTTSQVSASASQLTETDSADPGEELPVPESAPCEDDATTSSLSESDAASAPASNDEASSENADAGLDCWGDDK